MKCRWQTGHLHKIKAKLTFIFFSFPLFKSTLINVNWKIFSKYSHAPTHPSLWTLDPLSISNTWSNRIKLSTHVAIDPLRPTKGEIAMGKFSTWQPIGNDLVVVVRLNCPNYKLGKPNLEWRMWTWLDVWTTPHTPRLSMQKCHFLCTWHTWFSSKKVSKDGYGRDVSTSRWREGGTYCVNYVRKQRKCPLCS